VRPHGVTSIDRIGEQIAIGQVDDEILVASAFERDLDPGALILDLTHPPVDGVDAVDTVAASPLR